MSTQQNPPAFPQGERWTTTDLAGMRSEQSRAALHSGMTLRDWFAGKALLGVMAPSADGSEYSNETQIAAAAYRIADAMLAERIQPIQPTDNPNK